MCHNGDMETKWIAETEVQAGTEMVFLGNVHRVTEVETYGGPFAHLVHGIARWSNGQGMILCHGVRVEVLT